MTNENADYERAMKAALAELVKRGQLLVDAGLTAEEIRAYDAVVPEVV